jgi:hypothetical protein
MNEPFQERAVAAAKAARLAHSSGRAGTARIVIKVRLAEKTSESLAEVLVTVTDGVPSPRTGTWGTRRPGAGGGRGGKSTIRPVTCRRSTRARRSSSRS